MAQDASNRDRQVQAEATALWRELFGEPPPIQADGGMMLDIIMRSLPDLGYERLNSPHLRPSQIAAPRTGSRDGGDAR
jgi:hypothetical protein